MINSKHLLRLSLLSLLLLLFTSSAWFTSPHVSAAPTSPARYIQPPAWILGPIQALWGSEAGVNGVNDILDHLQTYNIPITAFHFDAWTWENCNNDGQLVFSDTLVTRLRNAKIRALFWIMPVIDKKCSEYNTALNNGYFVKQNGTVLVTNNWETPSSQGSWIDFKNPNAVAYWHSLLDQVVNKTGDVFGGFYTDDVPQELAGDSSYNDAFVLDLINYTRSKMPDGDVIQKAYKTNLMPPADNSFLSHYAHAAYVGDRSSDFNGMTQGIARVFYTANIPVPAAYNEFLGYDFNAEPNNETYVRRLHFGAFQAVMENDPTPSEPNYPWQTENIANVMPVYQYYSNLHLELVPYLHSYDEQAYETNTRIFRNTNPLKFSTQLGDQIFVNYVTDYMTAISVTIPSGQWINYWNEQQMYTGTTTINYPVPWGKEPIFIANGAMIQMQVITSTTGHGTTASAGALTVNVFPSGHSTFAYFDTTNTWVNFDSLASGSTLRLCTQPAPSQPLIYRIARWLSSPSSVSWDYGAVGVNVGWGFSLPALGSEAQVDGSTSGWYYDSVKQHLIIKITQVGNICPPSKMWLPSIVNGH